MDKFMFNIIKLLPNRKEVNQQINQGLYDRNMGYNECLLDVTKILKDVNFEILKCERCLGYGSINKDTYCKCENCCGKGKVVQIIESQKDKI